MRRQGKYCAARCISEARILDKIVHVFVYKVFRLAIIKMLSLNVLILFSFTVMFADLYI